MERGQLENTKVNVEKIISYQNCPRCGGYGKYHTPPFFVVKCERCKGSGHVDKKEEKVSDEKLMLCPFCKESAIVAMSAFQVMLFHLGFVFIAPEARAFCPKCDRLIISVRGKLYIQLEAPKGGAN